MRQDPAAASCCLVSACFCPYPENSGTFLYFDAFLDEGGTRGASFDLGRSKMDEADACGKRREGGLTLHTLENRPLRTKVNVALACMHPVVITIRHWSQKWRYSL